MTVTARLAAELKLTEERTESVIALLDEGNTVPFIARYRKEKTGAMDDVTLRRFAERLAYLRSLDARREEIRLAVEKMDKLTPELTEALKKAETLAELEDLYRPYRPRRRTRASVAREKGLEGLAEVILSQGHGEALLVLAKDYCSEEKGVSTPEEAVAGAMDIVAEDVSDRADLRGELRRRILRQGLFSSTLASPETEAGVYATYANFSQALSLLPDHRILAANRGEKEGILKIAVTVDDTSLIDWVQKALVKSSSPYAEALSEAIRDSFHRLIFPSLEREIRSDITERAAEGAVQLFSENLKHLLLVPPIRQKTVLGFDPGYRTGCKLAVVDPTGKVLDHAVIYPTKPREDVVGAEKVLVSLCKKWGVNTVAIGNGTAGKESEIFVADVIRRLSLPIKYTSVSESGASVYSASEVGAEEFPEYDVTTRSAVSIARRLQDPLAELVKIEPKSIGVGQYQHDCKPARLSEALKGVVESCVNAVGVDLNTASYMLLSYVAGLSLAAAKSIVQYREQNGAFRTRAELKKVPKIGSRAFEQAAGFLRIPDGTEPLDRTGVHPESYPIARALLKTLGRDTVPSGGIDGFLQECESYGLATLAKELQCGVPTLRDIAQEIEKPGRDMRDDFPQPILRSDVISMEDLKDGEVLTGTVRNVCDFGAFVDVGVHQDGLVHVSQLSDRFVRHPSQVVRVGQQVRVSVLSVDLKKKKISLTMKGVPQNDGSDEKGTRNE